MRSKRFRTSITAICGALALTMPAFAGAEADETPEGDRPAIVVTGKAEQTPEAVRKQARAITQVGGAIYHTPLPQFQDPVCPGITGVSREVAEVMVDRIRYNAEQIGLDTAREGKCTPNILVMFVANGQQAIKALARQRGYLFQRITMAELKAMVADAGPVHAWVNTTVRSRQGDELQGSADFDLMNPPRLNVAQSQSHIFLAHRLDILSSIVMIDLPAANGLSAVQLADYATMRAIVRTRPVTADASVTSILSLFDPAGERPLTLTDFDMAYLRTIYGSIPNLNAASKLAHINKALRAQQAVRQDED